MLYRAHNAVQALAVAVRAVFCRYSSSRSALTQLYPSKSSDYAFTRVLISFSPHTYSLGVCSPDTMVRNRYGLASPSQPSASHISHSLVLVTRFDLSAPILYWSNYPSAVYELEGGCGRLGLSLHPCCRRYAIKLLMLLSPLPSWSECPSRRPSN